MLSDLKYAFRQLAKHPGFTFVAVLILALGIASNTAVFTVIDALWFRGLPVAHPETLMLISKKEQPNVVNRFGYGVFEQFRDHTRSWQDVAAFRSEGHWHILTASKFGHSDGLPVAFCGVSGNFFSLLGVPAYLGRTLAKEDNRPGAAQPVAVLSFNFWKIQFGADPAVIGQTIRIDNASVTVVGVAAPGFSGLEVGLPTDVWTPIQILPVLTPHAQNSFQFPRLAVENFVNLVGRLHPGVKANAAQAELDGIFQGMLAQAGVVPTAGHDYGHGTVQLQPGGSGIIPSRAQTASLLMILMLVVAMVLVIAGANVASLLVARNAARQREFALRTALGAGRGVLIRQVMVESVLLAAGGGGFGLLFAHWGTSILAGNLPFGASLNLSPDGRVLAFTALLCIVTGILVGLLPALRFSRLNLIAALKDQAATVAGGSGQKLNKTLVVVQIGLSVSLLAGAGLFVRTLENLRNVDLGVNRSHLLLASLSFEKAADANRKVNVSRDLLAAFGGAPGIDAVSFSWGGTGLLSGGGPGQINPYAGLSVDGRPANPDEPVPELYLAVVGPDYFHAMGIALLHGRDLNLADVFPPSRNSSGTAVAAGTNFNSGPGVIISESIARKYFGGGDPIGHQITPGSLSIARVYGGSLTSFKIIGVVRNTKELNFRDDNLLEIYMPPPAAITLPRQLVFALRTGEDPTGLAAELRSVVRRVDPKMPAPAFTTLDQSIDRSLTQERLVAQTSGCFSAFALLLASLGLYGVLAYNVAQRTRELGVRMALGARSRDIVGLVLRQGLGLTLTGCAVGMAVAISLTHAIASRLYGVPALDPLTFLLAFATLFIVALLACWLPARRASKVDPMVALRAE